MRAAGLRPGDEVTIRANGDGELVVKLHASRGDGHTGIATKTYAVHELDRLRDECQR